MLFRDPKKVKTVFEVSEEEVASGGSDLETVRGEEENVVAEGEERRNAVELKEKGDDLGLVRPETKEGNRRVMRPEMTRIQSLV